MRKIIIIDRQEASDGRFTLKVAFWFDAPAKRRQRRVATGSAVANATTEELEAITSGAVIERVVDTESFPSGKGRGQIRNQLIDLYTSTGESVAVEEKGDDVIGTSWDGTAWTDGNGTLRAGRVI